MNLISIKLKTKKDQIANDSGDRVIGINGNLEIKDQVSGSTITELANEAGGKIAVLDIRSISLEDASWIEPLIGWAWENKSGSEIEFTLRNLKYDQTKGFEFKKVNTEIFLQEVNFEIEVINKGTEREIPLPMEIFEMNGGTPEAKNVLHDYFSLIKEAFKNIDNENFVALFDSRVKEYKNSAPGSAKYEFYRAVPIYLGADTPGQFIDDIDEVVEKIKKLSNFKIKSFLQLVNAKKNGFSELNEDGWQSQVGSDGKYKGFSITTFEYFEREGGVYGTTLLEVRYTKKNIDIFREFFPENSDKAEPCYFRGFKPGDIIKRAAGSSGNWWYFYKDKTKVHLKLNPGEAEKTKTIYDIAEANDIKELEAAFFTDNAFNELIGKSKKEHWELYKKEVLESQSSLYNSNQQTFKDFTKEISELFQVLDKSTYAGESLATCQTDLATLQTYLNAPTDDDQKKTRAQKWGNEINQKKDQIENRITVLQGNNGNDLASQIAAAADEDYGSGPLNTERKKLFTLHKNEIKTEALLNQVKALIKLLIQAEKATDPNQKNNLLNQLKGYQTESDQKPVYDLVNKVDNKWGERIITALSQSKKTSLEEKRIQLKTKYSNSSEAQAIFGHSVLDSVAALEEAEKLLLKVREAQEKSEIDATLISLLKTYQKAGNGEVKNKAWQAVNGYQQQAEIALQHLQQISQSRENLAQKLQNATNESELQTAFQQLQTTDLYQQGGKIKQVLDNINQRKKVCFQISQDPQISAANKNFLVSALVKLIPETIKDDNDELELAELENQLKSFQSASASEEKRKIYQNSQYKKVIDEVLNEVKQERDRYIQQREEENTPNFKQEPNEPSKGWPVWATGLIVLVIGGIVIGIVGAIWYQYKHKSTQEQ